LAGITFLVASTPLSTWTLPNLILAAALIAILLREPQRAMAGTPNPRATDRRTPSTRTYETSIPQPGRT
ncbi:MAG TPA: hypothetical protein VGK53_17530, partial [Propionicimonas sp.]